MELMRDMKDGQFDLAIVDPPYGISAGTMTMGRGSRNDTGKNTKSEWDDAPPTMEYFLELRRVSKNQIIWGGNYFDLPPSRCFLIWDKMDYNSDFASAELAWTSFDKVVKTFQKSRSTGEDKIHPTQKPVALYGWILKNYAKEGDSILDTHLGSASSAIACHRAGFNFMGIEKDDVYFELAKKRIDDELSQVRMF